MARVLPVVSIAAKFSDVSWRRQDEPNVAENSLGDKRVAILRELGDDVGFNPLVLGYGVESASDVFAYLRLLLLDRGVGRYSIAHETGDVEHC